jgi:integrase
VPELQAFLRRGRSDRFFALWVLEATPGIRRCELAGARRGLLNLDAGTLAIERTRVSVDDKVIESDGKTENAQRVLALDPFTLAALRAHVGMLERELTEFGLDYEDHGLLFCWENGRPSTRTPSRAGSRSWPPRPVSPRLIFMTCGPATPRWAATRISTGRR